MGGKWDHLRGKLPRLPSEVQFAEAGGQAYQERVDEAKAQFKDRRPAALLRELANQRRREDRVESILKQRHLRVVAVGQLLAAAYEAEGIDNLDIGGVGKAQVHPEPYPHVVNKEEYRLWCLENGFEQQMTLPWMSTASVVKQRLEGGEEPPPGVDVYLKDRVVFTRDRKS